MFSDARSSARSPYSCRTRAGHIGRITGRLTVVTSAFSAAEVYWLLARVACCGDRVDEGE